MKTMKNLMGLVMAAIVMSLVFVSCQKDDLSDHANKEEGKAKLVIDDKPTPKPVLTDTIYWHFRGDSLVVICDSLKDNVIFESDSIAIGYTLEVKRDFDERQTASTRLEYPNLGFTFADAINKQNGKMEYVGSQTGSDDDGQSYTINLTSGKIMNWHGLNGVHFVLNGTKLNRFDNKELTPKANESTRVESTMKWEPELGVAGLKNPEGKTLVAKRETKHERYILKNAPELIGHKNWKVWKETGNWNTLWHFSCEEIWSNDSVAPKSKMTTLKGTYSRKDLDDKTVSNLVDYTHPAGDLKWGNYAEIESKDAGVKLFEKKGTKKAYATNGFDADKFDTEFTVTMQKADVLFCDSLFHVESDEATLTNQRNVFVDEDSDRDGYSMVRFTDSEVAKWAGEYDQKLDETCKLYLKLAEPEVEKFLFDQDVKHTTDKVTVTTTGTPVYDNGTKGKSIDFVLEEPETFKCLDEFAFEKVAEVSETTGAMEKDGEVVKTKQTKNVKSGEYTGTYTYYKYEQKYRQPITCNGETKYQHWLATWYDDFSFVVKSFENKNYAKVASYSAIVEKDANHLTKSTSLSTEDLEVWLYSINGTFKLDNVERKDIGNGRITKVIGENYWDESTKGREITALEVKSWCEFIRFKSDGTKTSQKYTHVFNRVSGTSTWEVSAEKAEEVNGNIIPLAPVDNNRIDEFCHFTARLYEYDMTVDIQGAAQQKDFAKFTEAEEMYFEVEGKKVYFENPTHSISNTVRNLTVKSESDSETVYNHENVWSWNYGGVVTEVTSTGLIHVAKSQETPDFDMEVGKIYASVSRPSNRNGVNGDITAYTYLLVSKDGKKCLPLGIYHDVITFGEITDMESGFNSACYEKNENKVVATRCELVDGIIQYYRHATGDDAVDAGMFVKWQTAGFNNRGNTFENWQHKYAPKATKKGNVTVVTFEGTNVSYTFRGWNV